MTLEKAKKDENEYKLDMSEAKRPKNKTKKKCIKQYWNALQSMRYGC